MKDLVEVVPYDARWQEIYSDEVIPIKKVLRDIVVDAYHIGSTSVPELAAKPVIDIMIVVEDINLVEGYDAQMTAIGYPPKGECGIIGRRYFNKEIERDGAGKVNVHIYEYGEPQALRQLWFRDYLCEHPSEREAYAALKMSLAERFPYDIIRYVLGKSAFVQEVDHKALVWKALQGEHFIPLQPKKRSWTKPEMIKALDDNLQLEMTFFARYLTATELIVQRDVIVHRTDIPDDVYNFVMATHFNEENALRRVRDTINLFIEKNLPFSWWVGPNDTPDHVAELIQSQGLRLQDNKLGMCLPLENMSAPQATDLTIKRVLNHQGLKHFDRVYVDAGGSPDAFELLFHNIPSILYQEGSPLELYTGYSNDEPISIGMLCLYANVAGVYHVATVPHLRHEGYAMALLDFLLMHAKQTGYSLASAVVSKNNKALFEKKGFRECCVYREYAPKH